MHALDADTLRQVDKNLKVGRGLPRTRHDCCHHSCHKIPNSLFEHDETWWLVDKGVWAEQPMIDCEWEFSKRVLIKAPNEIDDVRHLGVTRGGALIRQLDVMASVMEGEE